MALNGTLEELAVLDVVQFVNQARLTGSLALSSGADRAELFYRKGALVHARFGPFSGLEVLVRIVDWTAGTFAFQQGAETAEETIRMDLHRAVMYALKTRDERKLEEERREAAQARQPREVSLREQLADVISQLDFVQAAAIFDATGVLASAGRNGASEDLAPLCRSLAAFDASHVRGRCRRLIIDDEKGLVLAAGLRRNRWVVIAAERSAALGTVMAGMGRLVAKLETMGLKHPAAPREALAGVV